MPLIIVKNDITKMRVDAIVNAANRTLRGGGGVDGMIHRAAGKELLEECIALGGCSTGKAKITGGYNLPAKYIIHTVGPVYIDGQHDEKTLLESCYYESLKLAKCQGCNSVAFPLISSGAYGYPKDQALDIAVKTISDFLLANDMTVYIVVFDMKSYKLNENLFSEITDYIERKYRREIFIDCVCKAKKVAVECSSSDFKEEAEEHPIDLCEEGFIESDLGKRLKELDESFSEMLLRMVDEKGITDVECYKKANIDRKLFSKIRSYRGYRPSKQTVIAFAIALELTLSETEDMLRKAGFALSHSNKFDLIIEYFIENGIYNVFEINQALFAFDQSLLGV